MCHGTVTLMTCYCKDVLESCAIKCHQRCCSSCNFGKLHASSTCRSDFMNAGRIMSNPHVEYRCILMPRHAVPMNTPRLSARIPRLHSPCCICMDILGGSVFVMPSDMWYIYLTLCAWHGTMMPSIASDAGSIARNMRA